MSIYAGVSSMMEMESHSGLMDPADDKFTKLIQEMDDFKNKFSPIPDARLSTGNGPHQDHLQEPSSAAAEAMITDSPILTEAEHCSHITAAQTQLKDREKAVDMMQQIIRHQGVLIDEGLMKPTALKPTLEGLKKAEDALAEITKRARVLRSSNDDIAYLLGTGVIPDQEGGSPEQRHIIALHGLRFAASANCGCLECVRAAPDILKEGMLHTVNYLWKVRRPDFGPGAMETTEDEWWWRMERAETINYSVQASAPGASNPELMETTSASIPLNLLASPVFHERLSEEERCARISTVTKKKDLAKNLYDAYAAALTGYSPDDDDFKELKIRHEDLQLAKREVSKLELCPLSCCKKNKIININSQIKRNAAHLNNHEHDNDGFTMPSKKLIAKVNCAKRPQHLVETKNSFDKLIVDEQEEQDSNSTPILKKMPPIM
ncbi:hypothetical protein CDAR_78111, partial [Caerostris darwini]